jgi:hypothetical protein
MPLALIPQQPITYVTGKASHPPPRLARSRVQDLVTGGGVKDGSSAEPARTLGTASNSTVTYDRQSATNHVSILSAPSAARVGYFQAERATTRLGRKAPMSHPPPQPLTSTSSGSEATPAPVQMGHCSLGRVVAIRSVCVKRKSACDTACAPPTRNNTREMYPTGTCTNRNQHLEHAQYFWTLTSEAKAG